MFSSKEAINVKEKIKEIHYDKNKNYSLNDYINLETLSLFTEDEFNSMPYWEQSYCSRIWTCNEEIINKYKINKYKTDQTLKKNYDKIIKNLHKTDKNKYISMLDFSFINEEDYSKLKIVDKLQYLQIQEFIEILLPEERSNLNENQKKILKDNFSIWIGSRLLSFIFTNIYLLYARRYGLFFLSFLLSLSPYLLPFKLLFSLCIAWELPQLCYEWVSPNMRKCLAENYEQWIWK